MSVSHGKLFVLSAPSGAGKTTLASAFLAQAGHKYNLERVITYTSKPPRRGEVPGHDYHYITKSEFEQKIAQNFFIEWSDCYGHYYGSPMYVLEQLRTGCSALLIIDRAGALQVKQQFSQAVLIWMYTKDMETLHERLPKRGTEAEEQIAKRMEQARKELAEEAACKAYGYYVCNDEFDQTMRTFETIVKKELIG